MSVHIGVDTRTLAINGGSQQYVKNLLNKFSDCKEVQITEFKPHQYLHTSVPEGVLRPTWENIAMPLRANLSDIDLFHGPKNVVPLLGSVPTVVTVHDLISFRKEVQIGFQKRMYRYLWKQYVESANHIIAISESTKSDLLNYFAVEEDNVSVVYHGVDPIYEPISGVDSSEIMNEFGVTLHENILLNVGTIKPNKNYLRLIKAFEILRQDGFKCSLLIAGRPGSGSNNVMEYIENSSWRTDIHVLGFVSDSELVNLYNTADVFVHPSLYEGFGLPPLEAMACGTPVVTSNTSSLPEIVGDAGLLIDPHNTHSISEAIKQILSNESKKEQLSKKGLNRSASFTWESSARQTLDVFKRTLSHSDR